ncbi:MAG TPA: NAD(P)-dependent oxidoreductase [Candidatus Binatia bacterium]
MRNEKILLTGPTSQVGFPIARALAANNEVYGLARLSRAEDRERLVAIGVKPLALDLAKDPLDRVPDDFTYVLNFAVVKTGDFTYDLAANAEAAGRLIARCRRVKAFLHCSSGGVYQYAGHAPLREDAPLGDNHRTLFPTYSISKIAAETVVRFAAAEFGVPSVIARLSVPYGDNGGWPFYHLLMMRSGAEIPVHVDEPNLYNPLHEDDYVEQVPKLLQVASVPARTLNWGGEQASIEEWCSWLAELTGLEPRFRYTTDAIGSLPLDLTQMHELIGPARVPWREGMRRMVEARAPELLRR